MSDKYKKYDIGPELLEYKLWRILKELEKNKKELNKYGDTCGALAYSKAIYKIKSEFNL